MRVAGDRLSPVGEFHDGPEDDARAVALSIRWGSRGQAFDPTPLHPGSVIPKEVGHGAIELRSHPIMTPVIAHDFLDFFSLNFIVDGEERCPETLADEASLVEVNGVLGIGGQVASDPNGIRPILGAPSTSQTRHQRCDHDREDDKMESRHGCMAAAERMRSLPREKNESFDSTG